MSDVIDLSQLPPPDALETLSFEAVRDAILDDLAAYDPALASLSPTDPGYHVAEVCAAREIVIRARVNDAIRSVLLSTAWGTNLDHIGNADGVPRLSSEDETGATILEGDDAYRARIHTARAAGGVGVRERYKTAALAADARVGDVHERSPDPAEAVIEWAPARTVNDAGEYVDVDPGDYAEIQANLEEALEEVRELADSMEVVQAAPIEWTVEGTLYIAPGPDPETVRTTAIAALRAYDLSERRVRHPRPLSAIHAALTVAGVVKVVLTTPSADVEPDPDDPEYLELGPDEEDVDLVVEVAPWLL